MMEQLDRLTRRYVHDYGDAVAMHDWCLSNGHIAALRAVDADHFEVTVIKSGGWERRPNSDQTPDL